MGMGPPTTTKVSDTCMTHVRQTRHFEITLSAPEGPKGEGPKPSINFISQPAQKSPRPQVGPCCQRRHCQ